MFQISYNLIYNVLFDNILLNFRSQNLKKDQTIHMTTNKMRTKIIIAKKEKKNRRTHNNLVGSLDSPDGLCDRPQLLTE